ncbi:ankyrin repeat-containing domain protein [Mycena rosella]|uniref:Ankyrin repeat-containing domain protein n=1 Tax=Mycena rosella TaxID=1033263 RepID=A0AAD7G7D4_MYCRO|nr:ankyrin repeat-containing domain protein [Mycena rosella]
MPGAGKTVLVSIVVDNLRKELADDVIGVAVIYLNHKETDAHSPSKLLASLWRQLVFRKPIWLTVHQLYEKHHEPRTRPSLDEDQVVLRSIIEEYSKVFILVDALDEYPQRDILLQLLSTLGPSVNLLVTSRPHIAIDHITLFETLEIRAREFDIRKYLEEQILKSPRLSKHIQASPDLREVIEAKIVQRSDGMFLLAKLHIDSLATKLTVKGVRDALNSLPRDLSGTFDEVVHRINRQNEEEKTLAWLVLSWVTSAQRPLEPSELRVALAIEEGSTKLNAENFLDTETIISVCAGLVTIHEEDNRVRLVHYTIQDYLEEIQNREFPHAHSKVTAACITYLLFDTFPRHHIGHALSKYLFSTHPLLDYAVNYTLIHAHGQPECDIKETILSFLDQCSGWMELWNWLHRLERIPTSGTRVWIAAFFDLREITGCLIAKDSVDSRAVYMAIVRGHTDVASILVGNYPYIQALGEYYGSALQFAISKKNDEILRLLLECSPGDLDARGGPHGRALQTAVSRGDLAMAKLLIEHDINIKWDGTLRSKLLTSCEEIIRRLIKYDIDIERGGWCSSGLMAASLIGCEATVRLLIESGADVNETDAPVEAEHESVVGSSSSYLPAVPVNSSERSRDNQPTEIDFNTLDVGNLPLLLASGGEGALTLNYLEGAMWEKFGSCDGFRRISLRSTSNGPMCTVEFKEGGYATEILERLSGDTLNGLIKGDGIRLSYGRKNSPSARPTNVSEDVASQLQLQGTDGEGNSTLVLINNLVSNEPDTCAISGPYGSALQAASGMGHEGIVRLLIEYGADINLMTSGGRYHNALQAASAGGYEPIVQLLIEHGANISFTDVLHTASSRGHEQIVRLLIKHGANMTSTNALQAASSTGNEQIVRLLMEHGANVDSSGALVAASRGGHEHIVRLLIEHGADINSTPALDEALSRGDGQIIRLLIEHGADVNSPTALDEALARGDEEIVRLLIEYGADVNSTDTLAVASRNGHTQIVRLLIDHVTDVNGSDAIKDASGCGREQIVQLLIEHGADVNSTDTLAAASRNGHENMVQLLIKNGANINSTNALQAASSTGNEQIVRLLMEHGADVNSTDALAAASRGGHEQIVQLLIQHGADVNAADALKEAARLGWEQIVRLLIEHGADVNSTDALAAASRGGHEQIVQLLIQHGADVNATDALREAVQLGWEQIVQLLIKHGADVNASNVLQKASEEGLEQIVRLLLEHGADANAGSTLHTASKDGHEQITRLLKEQNINHEMSAGLSARRVRGSESHDDLTLRLRRRPHLTNALQAASSTGNEQIVRLLMDHGADVNSSGALAVASRGGHEQIVRLFLGVSADINSTSALEAASQEGHKHVVELLLEHGGDINSSNALYAATEAGHHQIVQLLIKHRADANANRALQTASEEDRIVGLPKEQGVDHTTAPGLSARHVLGSLSHDNSTLKLRRRAQKNARSASAGAGTPILADTPT